jgi:hypothetical protein
MQVPLANAEQSSRAFLTDGMQLVARRDDEPFDDRELE